MADNSPPLLQVGPLGCLGVPLRRVPRVRGYFLTILLGVVVPRLGGWLSPTSRSALTHAGAISTKNLFGRLRSVRDQGGVRSS